MRRCDFCSVVCVPIIFPFATATCCVSLICLVFSRHGNVDWYVGLALNYLVRAFEFKGTLASHSKRYK